MTDQSHAIVIRPCTSFAELDACVNIQEQVWGYEERDIIPRRLFVVARRVGGQVFGAFPEAEPDKMIGFAMALPGIRNGEPYLHSHMLAVLPSWRNAGVGRRLKLAQRDEAMARGIRLMEWTFDPLEIKNAFLNIARLGVIVRSYTPNFYGPLHSELQAGMQSDRLHAEWWLNSKRVHTALAGKVDSETQSLQTIGVPQEIAQWKLSAAERKRAIELQTMNRELFLQAFANGLAVTGFKRDTHGNGDYLLSRFEDLEVEEHQNHGDATGMDEPAILMTSSAGRSSGRRDG
jgi:predicted GNAT superfamily acetyltransferase